MLKNTPLRCIASIFLLTNAIQVCDALVIHTYNASRHLRLTNFPSNPVHNTTFMHAQLDLSGVGWNAGNTNFQYTLVSPKHFVGANHAKPGLGHVLRFIASDGTLRDYTVESRTAIPNSQGQDSDLFIGTLTHPVQDGDGVTYLPYLNLASEAAYYNRTVAILGKPARGARQSISNIRNVSSNDTNLTRAIAMLYSPLTSNADDAYLETGDSGSPVFYDDSGVAALVGVNSLVSSSPSLITSYANFVPHYVSELNAIMETTGYRMTKSRPGSSTLSLNHQIQQPILRAGHYFDVHLTFSNNTSTETDNIRVSNTLPTGSTTDSVSGTGWFGDEANSRRAGISGNNSAPTYILRVKVDEPGTHQHSVSFSSDQSPEATNTFNFDVIESFLSYTSDLTNMSESGDDDKDGIINLLEYAFGGNPSENSRYFPGTTIPLLPVIANESGDIKLSFLRRTDATQRGISYQLTFSATLSGSWQDGSGMVLSTSSTALSDDIERVTMTLDRGSAAKQFFRIEVSLSET